MANEDKKLIDINPPDTVVGTDYLYSVRQTGPGESIDYRIQINDIVENINTTNPAFWKVGSLSTLSDSNISITAPSGPISITAPSGRLSTYSNELNMRGERGIDASSSGPVSISSYGPENGIELSTGGIIKVNSSSDINLTAIEKLSLQGINGVEIENNSYTPLSIYSVGPMTTYTGSTLDINSVGHMNLKASGGGEIHLSTAGGLYSEIFIPGPSSTDRTLLIDSCKGIINSKVKMLAESFEINDYSLESYTKRYEVVDITDTQYVVSKLDLGKILVFDSPSPVEIVVPDDTTENLEIGFTINFRNKQGGAITIVPTGTDIIVGAGTVTNDSTKLNSAYKESSGLWVTVGDLYFPEPSPSILVFGGSAIIDGALYVVGQNNRGQLGLGDTTQRNIWTSTGLTNVTDVAAGDDDSYAISGGELYVAGFNNYGQLGLGDTTQRNTWTSTGLTDVTFVAAAGKSAYAIVGDELYVAGRQDFGNFGIGDNAGRDTWTATGLTDVTYVVAGDSAYAISGGELYVTGNNYGGVLGLGDTDDRNTWTATGLTGVTSIYAAGGSIYAIANGELYVTGDNWAGQLGLGDTDDRNVWTSTGLTGVTYVAGNGSSGYVVAGGELLVAGNNNYGQLGLGDTNNRNVWTSTGLTNVTEVAGVLWGDSSYAISNGELYVTGYNWVGEFGIGNITQIDAWTSAGLTGVTTFSVSSNVSAYVIASGKMYVAGDNGNGQLGLGDTDDRNTWTESPLLVGE